MANNWWTRNAPQWLGGDPVGAEQVFNAQQAVLSRDFNSAEAQKTRDFNSTEAQKNRDFQERLSNTAYQRAFEDMRATGLNPYLAYGQGGASSPSGSMASSGSANGVSASAGHASTNFFSQLADLVIDVASAVTGSTKITNYNFGKK